MAFGWEAVPLKRSAPSEGWRILWGLYKYQEFSCTLGPLNLSMLIGVLVLALVAKKAFCGWACPIGFLGELGARLTGLFWKNRPRPSARLDGALKLLRYVALVLALIFTYKTGELILRGYDPFFLIFSGFGHGALGAVSWIVLASLVVGALVLPMFFCRYLCPLGATFDPFSRLEVAEYVQRCRLHPVRGLPESLPAEHRAAHHAKSWAPRLHQLPRMRGRVPHESPANQSHALIRNPDHAHIPLLVASAGVARDLPRLSSRGH